MATEGNNANVKFHLVEAEEVSPAPQKAFKKKGKTNWSQFPLEGENQSGNVDANGQRKQFNKHNKHKGRRGAYRGGRGGRRNFDNGNYYYNGVFVPRNDPTVTAEYAKQQIEYFFTVENLVHDTYLRQHMDVDGYVPVAFVASFQSVYAVHQDYNTLFEALCKSETLEMDLKNEKIRVRNDWKKWLWPNNQGGFGVPRYIKQSEETEETPEETPVEKEETNQASTVTAN